MSRFKDVSNKDSSGYLKISDKGIPGGVASLDGTGKIPSGQVSSTVANHASTHTSGGTDPITVAQSQVTNLSTTLSGKVDTSDSRLSDARTPTSHTHDDRYYTETEVDTQMSGKVATNDSRLTDARTPTTHNHDDRYYTETEADTLLNAKEATANKGVANGYAGLGSDGKVPSSQLPASGGSAPDATTTTKGIVKLAGDLGGTADLPTVPGLSSKVDTSDSRLSDARTPTAHNHDDRYFTETEINTQMGGKVDTSDTRLTNARTPTTHASTHGSAGSDPITIAQSQVTNLSTDMSNKVGTSDSRLTDARTPLAHSHTALGEIPDIPVTKLTATGTRDATTYLRGDNTWGTPAGGSPTVYPWVPLFFSHINLSAAAAGLYVSHSDVTTNVLSTAASPAQLTVVNQYIDPADYAISGRTLVWRLIASFAQNTTANAGTNVQTAGLYPVIPGGATTAWLPTYGAVVTSSTAAKTGGAASSESRVKSANFTVASADHYTLAVNNTVATSAGVTRIHLRLEFSYT